MKRVLLLTVMLIIVLAAPALAAEPGTGTIEGLLANGTENGSSTADQEVILHTYLNDGDVGSTSTSTDAEGNFIFQGLETGPDYAYQVTVTFQQADYASDWLSFDSGQTSIFAEVAVYDSTRNAETISVMMSHTVVYLEEGGLRISEYFLFVNDSDRTYIGSRGIAPEGTEEVLRFSLPGDATELQFQLGLMECCIFGSEEGFVETMPVQPGSKEVAYSYWLANNSASYTLSQKVNYATASFDFLVEGEDVTLASDRLADAELLDIKGVRYSHLSGKDLAAGETLAVQISGLPAAGTQGTVMWAALTLVLLSGGVVVGYLLRSRRRQPVRAEPSLKGRRQAVLAELARLDDDFEDGKITEDAYRKRRASRKARLVKLMQSAKEERSKR